MDGPRKPALRTNQIQTKPSAVNRRKQDVGHANLLMQVADIRATLTKLGAMSAAQKA
jgi:hypothetical protein